VAIYPIEIASHSFAMTFMNSIHLNATLYQLLHLKGIVRYPTLFWRIPIAPGQIPIGLSILLTSPLLPDIHSRMMGFYSYLQKPLGLKGLFPALFAFFPNQKSSLLIQPVSPECRKGGRP